MANKHISDKKIGELIAKLVQEELKKNKKYREASYYVVPDYIENEFDIRDYNDIRMWTFRLRVNETTKELAKRALINIKF